MFAEHDFKSLVVFERFFTVSAFFTSDDIINSLQM